MRALPFPLLSRGLITLSHRPSPSRIPSPFHPLRLLPPKPTPKPRLFSTRPPDTFDPIDDRDDHLTPPSTRGLSQSEFDALPPSEKEAIRQSELDLIAAEDTVASHLRPSDDDDEGDVEEGDFHPSSAALTSYPPRTKPSLFHLDGPPPPDDEDLPSLRLMNPLPLPSTTFRQATQSSSRPSPSEVALTPTTPSPPATPPSPC